MKFPRAPMTSAFRILAIMVVSYRTEASNCRFPNQWHGIWYQNSFGEVVIQENFFSGKGFCKEQYNDYYIIERQSTSASTSCSICMLIIQRHPNIIQYRESYCLQNVASARHCIRMLTTESPLYTLVKENAHPVECPFSDAFSFKYKNNTSTFCEKPASEVKPCAKTSKFHFRFRHCRSQSVHTHDKEMEFQCLATWKDGSDTYLYGGFSGPDVFTNNEMYRCFNYKTDATPATNISLAMSADASCQGLSSPRDGPVVMVFSRDLSSWDVPRCMFPEWLRHHTWRDLSGRHIYETDPTGKTWTIYLHRRGHGAGHVTIALRCNSIFQDDSGNFVAVSFTTDDCDSYYQCIHIRRVKDNVVEFSQGPPNTFQIDFCASDASYEYKQMLFHEDIKQTSCPFQGRLESKTSKDTAHIDVTSCIYKIMNGCNGSHVMQIENYCMEGEDKRLLECLSEWQHKGKHYVLVRQLSDLMVPSQEEADQRMANCLTYTYEGANLRIQTDLECNTGANDILENALEALLDGHAAPCQKEEPKDMTYRLPESGAASFTSQLSSVLTITLAVLLCGIAPR